MIFKRKNKKTVTPIYHLASSAKIKKRFSPRTFVIAGFKSRMHHEFNVAWIRAIKTMRF